MFFSGTNIASLQRAIQHTTTSRHLLEQTAVMSSGDHELTKLLVPSILALVVALGFYKYIIYQAFLSPLARIPAAHWSCHISPVWQVWQRWQMRENDAVYQLHEKKGPILRLRPNELSVNCVEEGTRAIYWGSFEKDKFFSLSFVHYGYVFHKNSLYTSSVTTEADPIRLEPMFAMKENGPHASRKRMVSNVLSKSSLLSAPDLVEISKTIIFDRLLPTIESDAASNTPTETLYLNYSYAMDSFTNFQFGRPIGSNFLLDLKQRHWWLDGFLSLRDSNFWILEFPRITTFLSKLGVPVLRRNIVPVYVDLMDWVLRMCDQAQVKLSQNEKFAAGDAPVVYAQIRHGLVKASEKWAPQEWPLDSQKLGKQDYTRRLEGACEMFDFIGAAGETSGITLTYLYWAIAQRPDVLERLRKELSSLSPSLCRKNSSGELPSAKDMDELPLLNAIVTETLRRWPAVPGAQPRITPDRPTTLAGYDNIPPNVKVQVYAYSMHRNKEVFPDPTKWEPDRWLTATPDHLKEMYRWYMVWGQGGRMCIGSNFAIYCECLPMRSSIQSAT